MDVKAYIKRPNFWKCLCLDFVFILIFIFLMMQYLPYIDSRIMEFDDILKESGAAQGGPEVLTDYAPMIAALQAEIESFIVQLIAGIFISANIVYALFFGLVLKQMKLLYLAKFFGVNVVLQLVAWFLFSVIVDVKGVLGGYGVLNQESRGSLGIFILLAYILYFFGMVVLVKLKGKNVYKKSKKLLSKNGWKLFGKYAILNLLFWIVLIVSQIPVFLPLGFFSLVLAILLAVVLFIPYMTISKIYLIEQIDA